MAKHLHRFARLFASSSPWMCKPKRLNCSYAVSKLPTIDRLFQNVSMQINGHRPLGSVMRLQHSDTADANELEAIEAKLQNRDNIQEEILRNVVQKGECVRPGEWNELKNKVLNIKGRINEQNFDAIVMGLCIVNKQWNVGISFYDMLCSIGNKPNLATVGRYLKLCYVCNKKQTDVLDICEEILKMHPVLDSTTAEYVMCGLSLTDEWKRGLDILPTMLMASPPTALCYNVLAKAAFDHQDYKCGWDVLEKMLLADHCPSSDVYIAWLKQCHAVGSDQGGIMVGQLLDFWEYNDLRPCNETVEELRAWFESDCYSWEGSFTELTPMGSCKNCHTALKKRKVSDEEFNALRTAFFERVLVGKDVYLKSNPEELESFREFLEHGSSYDVVVDGLNVAFSTGKRNPQWAAQVLESVVRQFVARKQHILVLGRRHMNDWPKQSMAYVREHASIFLTQDMSQDDPFLLYATMHSGPYTKFLSRDLMRGHLYLLRDPAMRRIFRRWQGHRQLQLVPAGRGEVVVRPPLAFSTSVQQGPGSVWHIPYNIIRSQPQRLSDHPLHWLCLRKVRMD